MPAVRLYLNPGDGHFSFFNVLDLKVIPDIDLRGYGRRPDGGDLDGDGDIDLVVPFDSSGSWLSFYFNQADPVSVDDGRANSPTDFVLEQNYPNPFNAETRIAFTLTTQARVRLTIYDVTGRQVITLADKEMLADRNWVRWDGRNAKGEVMASGVYFYKLEVLARNLNRIVKSRKMLLR
ncbi:MAG: T9SS type A sorting domain-containing protein [bacterium]